MSDENNYAKDAGKPIPGTGAYYTITLNDDEATMLWWCLWEKETQMRTRIQHFEHVQWPDACKSAAEWEANVLKSIRETLASQKQAEQGGE
jgi:hypothetical protein